MKEGCLSYGVCVVFENVGLLRYYILGAWNASSSRVYHIVGRYAFGE
ncbi:hypothetical protein EPHNCH_1101 [Anaplasma phagocytophilum str. NCH-1]|uniref:Uncharacterized protein n=2 Tax=Anaplasma phagocytophilum TaxID=948 RepID=Q2GJT8_ANAPZ|nr:hypothetical protein APH_0786 [Anaplasma phagocytophilum str. HZ]KJV63075.1 hypothetical protein EPHNCH_1101 [Anaplasma phagocytophilum str. NCH-1]KJV86858.1 hypothetical protein APHNYW_0792 [Anaplasma phagocytophilum str. ApNYW]